MTPDQKKACAAAYANLSEEIGIGESEAWIYTQAWQACLDHQATLSKTEENGKNSAEDVCLRCQDWERMGLSATCPSCDIAELAKGETMPAISVKDFKDGDVAKFMDDNKSLMDQLAENTAPLAAEDAGFDDDAARAYTRVNPYRDNYHREMQMAHWQYAKDRAEIDQLKAEITRLHDKYDMQLRERDSLRAGRDELRAKISKG